MCILVIVMQETVQINNTQSHVERPTKGKRIGRYNDKGMHLQIVKRYPGQIETNTISKGAWQHY